MLCHDAIPAGALDLLNRLMTSPACDPFDLGGGTALALRIGHRLSIDLDLFTVDGFDPDVLLTALPETRGRRVKGEG